MLVERIAFIPANASPVSPALDAIDRLRAEGKAVTEIADDRGFSYALAENWAYGPGEATPARTATTNPRRSRWRACGGEFRNPEDLTFVRTPWRGGYETGEAQVDGLDVGWERSPCTRFGCRRARLDRGAERLAARSVAGLLEHEGY